MAAPKGSETISSIAKATDVMERVCLNLESLLNQLAVDLINNGWLPGYLSKIYAGEEAEAKRVWVQGVQSYVQTLKPTGTIGARVLEGKYAWSQWDKDVTDVHSQIAHEYGDFNTWGYRGLIDGVVIKTAVDTKNIADKAASAASTNFYPILILVVIGVIALAVVKVA